jgi:hypothetical protein
MVAVSETGLVLPVDIPRPTDGESADEGRRVVAIAVSPMELLRPGSDLLNVVRDAATSICCWCAKDEARLRPEPGVACWVAGPPDPRRPTTTLDTPDDDIGRRRRRACRRRAARGSTSCTCIRLGLRLPLGRSGVDGDLVAALSELVGFDPEPGVQCLAPVPLPTDPARAAIERAVWQIAEVYGLPVQRYRCLELSVVDA